MLHQAPHDDADVLWSVSRANDYIHIRVIWDEDATLSSSEVRIHTYTCQSMNKKAVRLTRRRKHSALRSSFYALATQEIDDSGMNNNNKAPTSLVSANRELNLETPQLLSTISNQFAIDNRVDSQLSFF